MSLPNKTPAALAQVDAPVDVQGGSENATRRKRTSLAFYCLCLVIAFLSVMVLVVMLVSIAYQGHSQFSSDLIRNAHSELSPERSGMRPAIIGSLLVCGICAAMALPLGIGTAIYLEEFKPRARLLRWLHGFIQLNIANLAGVPSIVYGLLGLTVFVHMFNVFGRVEVNQASGWELMGADHYYQVLSLEPGQTVLVAKTDMTQSTVRVDAAVDGFDPAGEPIRIEVWDRRMGPKPVDAEVRRRTVKRGAIGGSYSRQAWYYFRLPFGKSFLAAGLTLALVILPVIIISSQEALRAVSPSLREAALGLGATPWQATRDISLPAAIPGIMTGAILAMGRAIGEAAPVLMVLGAAVAKDSGPANLMDSVVTMPVLVFNWAGRPQAVYQELAAAAIIVLLIILLTLNSIAILVRQRMQTP